MPGVRPAEVFVVICVLSLTRIVGARVVGTAGAQEGDRTCMCTPDPIGTGPSSSGSLLEKPIESSEPFLGMKTWPSRERLKLWFETRNTSFKPRSPFLMAMRQELTPSWTSIPSLWKSVRESVTCQTSPALDFRGSVLETRLTQRISVPEVISGKENSFGLGAHRQCVKYADLSHHLRMARTIVSSLVPVRRRCAGAYCTASMFVPTLSSK